MNVTIIGTGNMARGIGMRLVAGGHDVTVLGKETAAAEDVVRDLGGDGSAKAAVEQYGDGLAGKVLIDITNPVNETFDGLVTPPDGSAAQELAASAGGAKVVKAFNTTFAPTLGDGKVAGQPLDVFVAGDDEEAKATVSKLAADGGLNPIDVGPLKRARELEAMGLLHMTLQGSLGTGFSSAIKILA